MVRFEVLEKGQDIGSRTVELSRASLVRYPWSACREQSRRTGPPTEQNARSSESG